jgi:hypothetical protein
LTVDAQPHRRDERPRQRVDQRVFAQIRRRDPRAQHQDDGELAARGTPHQQRGRGERRQGQREKALQRLERQRLHDQRPE